MDIAQLTRDLPGTWRHSHEEDRDGQTVYRPDTYDFPPSRGRRGFTLRADHTGMLIGISPRDGSTTDACRWALDEREGGIVLTLSQEGAPLEAWPVVEGTRECLCLGAALVP